MTYIIGAVAIAAFTSGFAMALWFSQENLGKAYRMGKRDGHREVRNNLNKSELADIWELWHRIINRARKICKMELSQRKNPYREIIKGDFQND